MLVGIISDTHGLMRPEALAALRGSHVIIHAGDVGNVEVIDRLRQIAPAFAVRGNTDLLPPVASLPATTVVTAEGHAFFVLHDISDLRADCAGTGYAAVVFGHSHRASIEMRGAILYLNPGSAGPRRFNLPVTIARVDVSGKHMKPEIVALDV